MNTIAISLGNGWRLDLLVDDRRGSLFIGSNVGPWALPCYGVRRRPRTSRRRFSNVSVGNLNYEVMGVWTIYKHNNTRLFHGDRGLLDDNGGLLV